VSGRLVEFGYAAGWRVVRTMPERVARSTFRAAADAAYRRGGRGVRQLAENLRRVVGPGVPEEELAELVRAGMRSYARYWMEAFRLPAWSPTQIRDRFRLDGARELDEVLAAGNGAVVALPHAGNWDAAGAWAAAAMGWRVTTVAERLRPEGLFQRFVAFRESLGLEIIPLRGGQRPPLEILAERLAQGHLVPLLADRDLSARGVEVTFFGARTRMPAGPALLALRTGAPLYVLSMWYEPDAVQARLHGPLPPPPGESLGERVQALTQTMADHFARGIAAHPQDWHMLQRLWLPTLVEPRAPAADSSQVAESG
jgi:KDO2-lipid IV(A) lauroyltransferase